MVSKPDDPLAGFETLQRAALLKFGLQHGADWKAKLHHVWRQQGYSGALLQLRHQFGSDCVDGISHLPAYKIEVELTTADQCQGRFDVVMTAHGAKQGDISWSPGEPGTATVKVLLSKFCDDQLADRYEVSPEIWRRLEDHNAFYERDAWERVLCAESLSQGINDLVRVECSTIFCN